MLAAWGDVRKLARRDFPASVRRLRKLAWSWRRGGNAMAKLGLAVVAAVAVACASALPIRGEGLVPPDPKPYGADLLARVRVAATAIPGTLPARINYLKVAESHRPLAEIIEGGSQENYVSARTAFQVVYPPASWVMINSGMD